MSANINSIYIKEKNYIAVFIIGILNTELALKIISYTKDEMEHHNCPYVLFDISDTLSSFTTSENYELTISLNTILPEKDYKWAVFYKNDAHLHLIISNITQKNDLINLKITDNRNKAIKWILNQNL